jgi:hypothetical protein
MTLAVVDSEEKKECMQKFFRSAIIDMIYFQILLLVCDLARPKYSWQDVMGVWKGASRVQGPVRLLRSQRGGGWKQQPHPQGAN